MSGKVFNEEEIFKIACQIGSSEARAAYVSQVCGDKRANIERIEELLRVFDRESRFLESPLPDIVNSPTKEQVPTECPGTQLGPYKLLQQIGEGGMGVVYMAEQTQPVQRKVALKVIKPGMDSKQVIARFEAERQALAMMDHVNIARVIDGGTTETGRPYFVMELIHGIPITKYCDDNHLTPRERLELFIPVCQAVQHAHQKGIIHRDIKPSNVLITLYDGKPVPKVIDFGVAKAIDQKLTDNTLFTNFGTMVGTLEYMSPEQAELSNLGVDTRSDIYSLGVLLYELLTGSTPLTRKRLKDAANLEVLRMIKEEEPQKPSTRLSDSGEALASISAMRKTEPAKLSKLMRGELDWIVMKTLEKNRNRRYETANGLAVELQRYLADEPVLACPPSKWYRMSKFVRKNKVPVIAASLVLLALIGGVIGTTYGLYAEAQRAEGERQAKLDVDRKRQEAERNLAFAKKGNEILGSVFSNLDPKRNYETVAELRTALRDNLSQAVRNLEGSAIGDPLEVAAMQNTIGESLLALGESSEAIAVFEKASDTRKAKLGFDHPDTLKSMDNLATGYRETGKLHDAIRLYEHIRAIDEKNLGADHPSALTTLNNLALAYASVDNMPQAIRLIERVAEVETKRLGADDQGTLKTLINLAMLRHQAGQAQEAIEMLEKVSDTCVKKLGADHPDTLSALNNLGFLYRSVGKLHEATRLFEKVLNAHLTKLGADHPASFMAMNNLAMAYLDTGKVPEAIKLLEQVSAGIEKKMGADHPNTLKVKANLADAYKSVGKRAEAIHIYEQILPDLVKKLGPDHSDTLQILNKLAAFYQQEGRILDTIRLLEQLHQALVRKLGVDDPKTLGTLSQLAVAYWSAKQLDKSIPLFEEILKRRDAKHGRDHSDTLMTVANLGVNYKDAGRLKEAMPLLEEAHRNAKKYPALRFVAVKLLVAYAKAGETAKYTNLLQEQLSEVRKLLAKDSPELAQVLAQIGKALLKQRKWTEADPFLRECLAIREKTQPDVWSTFNTKSMLGGVLVGQKKYAEAELLLIKGYEGLKVRENTIPPDGKERLPEAIERLAQLYDETGKKEQADEWRKEAACEETRQAWRAEERLKPALCATYSVLRNGAEHDK